jgi:hypothetical protein
LIIREEARFLKCGASEIVFPSAEEYFPDAFRELPTKLTIGVRNPF